MKYHVRVNSGEGLRMIAEVNSLRQARTVAEPTEVEWVEMGVGLRTYLLRPHVKKGDMQYGRLVYTSWVPGAHIPVVSVTEVP